MSPRKRWQPRLLPPAPPRPPAASAAENSTREATAGVDDSGPPIIWALGGVSGSGKTTAVRNHPVLSTLPVFDIGDVYERFEAAGQSCDFNTARAQFFWEVGTWLGNNPTKSIVLEAFFNRGGPQRDV